MLLNLTVLSASDPKRWMSAVMAHHENTYGIIDYTK